MPQTGPYTVCDARSCCPAGDGRSRGVWADGSKLARVEQVAKTREDNIIRVYSVPSACRRRARGTLDDRTPALDERSPRKPAEVNGHAANPVGGGSRTDASGGVWVVVGGTTVIPQAPTPVVVRAFDVVTGVEVWNGTAAPVRGRWRRCGRSLSRSPAPPLSSSWGSLRLARSSRMYLIHGGHIGECQGTHGRFQARASRAYADCNSEPHPVGRSSRFTVDCITVDGSADLHLKGNKVHTN